MFVLLAVFSLLLTVPATAQAPQGEEFFEKKIRPVLADRCYLCHGADAPQVQGGLLLDSRQGVLTGGNSGSAVKPGDPDRSLLLQALRYGGRLKMPPDGPLSPEVVRDFEAWIRMGAPDPRTGAAVETGLLPDGAREHWSFQPPEMPQLPSAGEQDWVRNPIDRFILAKLREKGIEP